MTATPMPLALFHYDRIIEFKSRNPKANIKKIEIVEADDTVEYVKGHDYDKEFPIIRLNNIETIKQTINDMQPARMGKISAEDKEEPLYQDIVENGKIDGTGIDGIFTTSVMDSGTNITEYPENTVPIAVCERFFLLDDIEQFFNRTRKGVDCARVVIRKVKEEIIVKLLSAGEKQEICTFEDVELIDDNKLIIKDTDKMNSIKEDIYIMRISINGKVKEKEFMVCSIGVTEYDRYSKIDPMPVVFSNIAFRPFLKILEKNKKKVEEHKYMLSILLNSMCQAKQALTSQQAAEIWEQEYYNMIEKMTLTGIQEIGELSDCMSYDNVKHEIVVDFRIMFMISYKQYQQQYLYYPEQLKKELEKRMGAPVSIKEVDTSKGTRKPHNKENIWENNEDLRIELSGKIDKDLYDKIMGTRSFPAWDTDSECIYRFRKQEHLMKYLKEMEGIGIRTELALNILISSRTERKINKYKKMYKLIINNQWLQACPVKDANEVPMYNKYFKENQLQAAIFCYLKKNQNTTFTVTDDLLKEIMEYYKRQFPMINKKLNSRKINKKLAEMYKPHGRDNNRRGELRTNEKDILKIVEPDYKK